MSRFVDVVERVTGLILLAMASLTSISAFSRYLLALPIPDEYEFSRLSLGVVICWAMAAAFRHRDHIQLDIFWDRTPVSMQRVLTRIGMLVCLLAIAFFSWALAVKVLDSFSSGLVTVDLGVPMWAFHAAAWVGTIAAMVNLAAEVVRPSQDGAPGTAQ